MDSPLLSIKVLVASLVSISILFLLPTAMVSATSISSEPKQTSHRWHGYLTWASDYVYRGVSQSDAEPVWQAGLHYQHSSGLSSSLWTTQVHGDFPGPNTEYNWLVGWGRPINRDWQLQVTWRRLFYRGFAFDNVPNIKLQQDEYELSASYQNLLTLRYQRLEDTYGSDKLSHVYEMDLNVGFTERINSRLTYGHWDFREALPFLHNYSYFNWETQYNLRHLQASLTYHMVDQSGRHQFPGAAKSSWVLAVSVGF